MTELLHQLGFRFNWNISSCTEENTGSGTIIGPRYMSPKNIEAIPKELKKTSFFDPQFFLPNSAVGKLSEYAFFPHVLAEGFITSEWDESTSFDCAHGCVEFQTKHEFSGIIIPGRFYEGMPSNFIQNQEQQFVIPFLEAIEVISTVKAPVYLQVIVTDQMIKDDDYRSDLLNWITSYPEIDGIYLIYHIPNRPKQITDINFIVKLLEFISVIKAADMAVMVGYTNIEAILLTCAGADSITMGSYENLRMFSLKSFEDREPTPMRGPTPRVYIPKLLQWIDYQYIGAIDGVVDDLDEYIEDNNHRIDMFEPAYQWHFGKPHPYLHYFSSFSAQISNISAVPSSSIVAHVISECENAINEFANLRSNGIVFADDSGGNHISSWITALNMWNKTNA